MLTRPFTEQDYANYERFIRDTFKLYVVDRNDVPELDKIAFVIDAIRMFRPNMPSGKEWLANWSFAFADRLFIAEKSDPIVRASILAHEAQHGVQWHRTTPQADVPHHLHMWWLYVVEPEARIRLEVEALRAGNEVYSALTGTVDPATDAKKILEGGYVITPELGDFSEQLYRPAELAISQGLYSTEIGIATVSHLRTAGLIV